jgi:hypothetical protein
MGVASKVSMLGCIWGIVFFCSETNTDMRLFVMGNKNVPKKMAKIKNSVIICHRDKTHTTFEVIFLNFITIICAHLAQTTFLVELWVVMKVIYERKKERKEKVIYRSLCGTYQLESF